MSYARSRSDEIAGLFFPTSSVAGAKTTTPWIAGYYPGRRFPSILYPSIKKESRHEIERTMEKGR